MRTRTITTTAALLLAVTACTSGGADDKPAAAKSTAEETKPEPSATPDKPRAFGEPLNFTNDADGSAFKVTVLGYEQGTFTPRTSADEEFGTTGYTWAALEIKACMTKGANGITRYPWVLAYSDGARIEPSSVTYGDFPKPEYPYEADLKAGDCVRGKTVFAVPAKQRPERVLYTSQTLDTPAEWAVPKA